MEEKDILAIKQLKNAISDDSLIMFVGAGISANSNLPTWKELIDELSGELGIDPQESKDFLRVAQYYYDTFGQNQYIKKIEEIFKTNNTFSPNELHHLIEKISPKHIITTNYDSLLEQQFEHGLLKYSVVAEDKDIPYSRSEKYLIKMHGDFRKKNIVLKEDDYLDYQVNFPMTSTLVQSVIMNHTLLFVGYSLGDSTFNSIFRLIQNNFNSDAKRAYFYTPNAPSDIIRDYYKKKGIVVVSNPNDIVTNTETTDNNKSEALFLKTKSFLEALIKSKYSEVESADDLWKQLSFLDRLNFIDSRDISKYSGLKSRAINFNGSYRWYNKEYFNINGHSYLEGLIKSKSLLNGFFDLERVDSKNLRVNTHLEPAYKLYKSKEYSLAKAKFRELANDAYRDKDYFTFLLCEFNFKHIHHIFSEDDKNYQSSVFDKDLNELTQQMIDSSSGDDKKIFEYFRDVILNMSFLDKKLEIINDLFDKVRHEHTLYRTGGSSYNSHLWNAEFEIKNLQYFLDLNCICVKQYKPYKAIINRYFEILLLSYDNSYIDNEPDSYLKNGDVSSLIGELGLEDLKIILPNIDFEILKMYLSNYSFKAIKITDEATQYIFNRIKELQLIERLDNLDSYNEYKQFLKFLPFIEYTSIADVIDILDKQALYFDLSAEIKDIIKVIINNKILLNSNLKQRLVRIVNRHINDIIDKNLQLYKEKFWLYSKLLDVCSIAEESDLLHVERLENDILKIKYSDDDVYEIMKYCDLFVSLFPYLRKAHQEYVRELFSKYDEFGIREGDYYSVIQCMLVDVYDFPKYQGIIYNHLVEIINKEDSEIVYFPDPVKTALSNLFNLINKGYFKESEVTKDITKNIKGIFPEVDWVWFNDRSESVMERMLRSRTRTSIKIFFAKTNKDKEMIDNFILKLFDEEKIIFHQK
ncbi:SIR2 family protein [Streptococcus sp. E29BA]|uniref:SIR2 family protein n=1 Tax=Streptococcus sp. E29BA TaxID=3278716 RepID=UPI00359E54D0